MKKDQIKSKVELIEFYYKWAVITAAETCFNKNNRGKPFQHFDGFAA